MRKKFIAGNWKMFNGPAATQEFMDKFANELKNDNSLTDAISKNTVEVAIFTPFISLESAVKAKADAPLIVGAQNMHWEKEGAFTGEISAPMLKEIGCTHVIIGHSERRHIFKEDNEAIHKKVLSAIEENLTSVLCVGELLEERENNSTFDVIRIQLLTGIKGIDGAQVTKGVIIAYEPVWAIGTGKTASAQDAQEVCAFIRKLIADTYGEGFSDKVLILYGGSVKPENTAEILGQKDIDGVLVGGASLKPASFMSIVKAAL